ncbi:MAG: hypothetical protein ABSE06_05155 [Anaerolineaceae bacterium]
MTSSLPSRWQSLAPDWKAALVVTVFLGLLGFLSDLLPGLGFILSIPFTILVYYIQGVLVGFYARRNLAYHRKKFWLLGMKSGLWASLVIGSIFTLIALAIQYTLTLGTALFLIPLIIAQSLFEIVMNVTFSGLGAWLYGLIGGARMLWISAGVVGCGTLLASGLALLLAIILAWLGIQIIKDLFHSMPILMIDTSAWTLVVHLVA